MSKNQIIISVSGIVIAGAILLFFFMKPDLNNQIVMPYISHMKPAVDPHLPGSVELSDKLDEVLFDGLFNISANPSGIVYEDGLGELIGIDENNVVSVRLKTDKKWHSSYEVRMVDDEVVVAEKPTKYFTPDDLRFTLNRIQQLGSLSPDYILVSQAMRILDFTGPGNDNVIRFNFRGDRIWSESDIKEVLSFKVLPAGSDMNALNYTDGTASYISIPPVEGISNYYKNPSGNAAIENVILTPFIDNSTFPTELNNGNINTLLNTPFGSLTPILRDREDFFFKSSISTTFFAVLFNVERLSKDQRKEVRKLIDNEKIINRFFKVGTEQRRSIVDYKGNKDNYTDYLNNSIFPSSTYYVEEQIVMPVKDNSAIVQSLLPDTLRMKACLNFGHREEYAELVEIFNDPSLFNGKIKVSIVDNEVIKSGDYDALLIAIDGYRSNFLFDLYNILLREPDLSTNKINLITTKNSSGESVIETASLKPSKNFFRLDADKEGEDKETILTLLDYTYGFMSTKEIGDKQGYAERIDRLENELCLGAWLFSLPSLSYFSTQFDYESIDLYGVASQLSTIEKWKEKAEE